MVNWLAYVFLTPLFLTLVFEGIISYLVGYRDMFTQKRIALSNLLTNVPINVLHFLLIKYIPVFKDELSNYYVLIIVLEALVILAEWKLFAKLLRIESRTALIFSFILNISSYLIGICLLAIFRG